MAIQMSILARNDRLDAIETQAGVTPVLKLFTGAQPADCATANSGTELCSMDLPSDWMAAASGGTKALSGSWTDVGIGGGGTAAHFRLYKSDGTTCVMQGSVGLGSGDLQLDNNVIADDQVITITAFTLTDGNA
jgi:hypothetical protein